MVLISGRSKTVIKFIGINERVLEVVNTQYSMKIERTLCMKISKNGRIFILDSGDNNVEEITLREINSENSLKENVTNLIKSLFIRDEIRTMMRVQAEKEQFLGGLQTLIGKGKDWLSSRRVTDCQFELDETRNILYQLLSMTFDGPGGKSKRSLIRVYDLGEKSNGFTLVGEIDYDKLVAEACFFRATKLMPVNPNAYKIEQANIVSVSPIPVFDSEAGHLLVSLINGFRIYLGFRTQKKESGGKNYGGFYRCADRPLIKFEILDIKAPQKIALDDVKYSQHTLNKRSISDEVSYRSTSSFLTTSSSPNTFRAKRSLARSSIPISEPTRPKQRTYSCTHFARTPSLSWNTSTPPRPRLRRRSESNVH
jgi:hypothetical protein